MSVIIGMDPHKRSATIEIVDDRAWVLTVGRYGTDKTGYAQMLAAGRKYADRVWAVEGCNGVGKHIAHRLLHDGETVRDVPAKLSAQVRVFATGNGRKTDPVDAHFWRLRRHASSCTTPDTGLTGKALAKPRAFPVVAAGGTPPRHRGRGRPCRQRPRRHEGWGPPTGAC